MDSRQSSPKPYLEKKMEMDVRGKLHTSCDECHFEDDRRDDASIFPTGLPVWEDVEDGIVEIQSDLNDVHWFHNSQAQSFLN